MNVEIMFVTGNDKMSPKKKPNSLYTLRKKLKEHLNIIVGTSGISVCSIRENCDFTSFTKESMWQRWKGEETP